MFECNLPELFQIPRQTLLKFRKFHLARTTFHVTRLHEIPLYTAMPNDKLSNDTPHDYGTLKYKITVLRGFKGF
jgi:hypothetical protein